MITGATSGIGMATARLKNLTRVFSAVVEVHSLQFAVSRLPHVNIADLTVICMDHASSTIVKKVTS